MAVSLMALMMVVKIRVVLVLESPIIIIIQTCKDLVAKGLLRHMEDLNVTAVVLIEGAITMGASDLLVTMVMPIGVEALKVVMALNGEARVVVREMAVAVAMVVEECAMKGHMVN